MYTPHWSVLLIEPYPSLLLEGVRLTLLLTLFSSAASFVLGAVLAAGRASDHPALARFCSGICTLVRSLPGVFWLLLLFFALPVLLPRGACLALNGWDGFPFYAAALGLTINNAPYLADILFSVLDTAGKDALAHARLSGLRGFDYWGRVALPMAVAISLPALASRFLHNYKNTSLAMVVSVPELTWASQEIESLSFAGLEVTTAVTVIYCILGACLSGLLALLNRHLRRRFRLDCWTDAGERAG